MENTNEMIAYCGLYCGECPNHTGRIADLARDLRKELRTFRFEKTAETLSKLSFFSMFKDYEQCYGVLVGKEKGSSLRLTFDIRCNKKIHYVETVAN